MILDKEEHRIVLLDLINKAVFPGQFAEDVVELKRSLKEATIAPDDGEQAV